MMHWQAVEVLIWVDVVLQLKKQSSMRDSCVRSHENCVGYWRFFELLEKKWMLILHLPPELAT